MACEYCKRDVDHDYRCPNYEPPKSMKYCAYCYGGIHYGDKYITNNDGECCHYDCFFGMKGQLEWLGIDVETMEEEFV